MTMLTVITSAVEGIQAELAMFLLAFFLHMVVFRNRSIPHAKGAKQMQSHGTEANCKKVATGKYPHTPGKDGGCTQSSCSPFHQLAAACAADSKQSLAAKVRSELQQVPIEERVNALTSFLQGAVKGKVANEQMLSVVHLLLEEDGLKPSLALAECMLQGHTANGDVSSAQQTIETMLASGFQPKLTAFNQILDAAVKRCPKQVWIVIDKMQSCSAKPDRITCGILLKTIQTNSTYSNVKRILTIVDDLGEQVDEVLLSSIVEACLRIGRPDLLEPYLKNFNIKYVQVKSPHTYGSIIRAYGFLKDTKGVWDTWREMKTRHVLPTSVTLGCMVEALITNGDVEAGYDFIRDVSKDEANRHQINAVIYGSVLKGFAQQKKFERLWSVYQEMLDLNLQFSIVTFNTLIDACARAREMNRIPALLESMVAQGIEPNIITYSAILKGYCQANRLDEAFQLVEQMLQTTEFRPDEIMYNTLLDGCARQGLYDKGMAVLQEMQQFGVLPTNFTLSVLVKLASRSKRLDRAFELSDEISSKYKFRLNMHVYSNLVHGCVMDKDVPRAMEVLVKMLSERVRPDARTYESLLRACIAEYRAQDAAGLLRAAFGLRGVHPKLAGTPANLLQPQGRLTVELVEHVLDGIAGLCKDATLALELFQDLRRVPGLRLDPKLQLQLATKSGRF